MLDDEPRYVEGFALGMWQTNCYILGDVDLGRAVVVDPGQDGAPTVRERLAARGVTCEAILLTHGHLDHVWAVPELAAELGVPVLLHSEDHYLWQDPFAAFDEATAQMLRSQLALEWDASTDQLDVLRDGQTLRLAGVELTVRHTPGHTPGSCVFLLPDRLVSGDLVFAGSVGRTDFPRGSWEQQCDSLRRVVLPLSDDTVIMPGHGPETTVGEERTANPFLTSLSGRTVG